MLNSVNTSYIVKRQHQLVWFMESWEKSHRLSKLNVIFYNVLLMLYNINDYKSPWLKYVENTLNVNGLGFYWLTQAVDNIDSFMYIVKTRLTDQFKQE